MKLVALLLVLAGCAPRGLVYQQGWDAGYDSCQSSGQNYSEGRLRMELERQLRTIKDRLDRLELNQP